eukprot:TRINITY_DN11477_c0_g1::TRINITY_DN11477_c0_g1_i1::g.10892::m.10892 TRINITY_DN11477_c0_g1::TRINITY_DN11477_c0_g1_i1::g.10892  ORF type:complete len:577 (-),score=62.27,sp/O60508/PRP17_HUMAN/47.55/1e-169,WD40/PF00400.27/1.1e-08,WD40/PF00400.27/7.5e-09,WD40/PF00400.27/0.28,WD40/PF00400.27/0.00018,WD40/PF00400.27/76,WD40/PF00400.27/3.9e+02,WD40/PF00400.27/0.00024,Nup160/PF11715.3/1.1,Nup160/PF11715.3/3.9 TRINITY_DN11477_c0_g1_i1:29-1726(-)
MDLPAQNYGEESASDDENLQVPEPDYKHNFSLSVNLAPSVLNLGFTKTVKLLPGQNQLAYNPTYDELWAHPVAGPSRGGFDVAAQLQSAAQNNVLTGRIEEAAIEEFHFNEQHDTYQALGYSYDPNSADLVGDLEAATAKGGITVTLKSDPRGEKKRKEARGDPGDLDGDFKGPWARPLDEIDAPIVQITEEQRKFLDEFGRKSKRARRAAERKKELESEETNQDKTIFHLDTVKDYQGRSFMDPPTDIHPSEHECYVPKRVLHEWRGHTKGVQAIQFFPKYGHLLLSASMDGKVKIWDVYNHRKVVRTYIGHTKAVRSIDFNNDGRQFLSIGYDRLVKLWDTETGKVIRTFTYGKIPYCVKFHPDKPNEFLVGGSDKKILQYDINKEEWAQEYDQHLAAVNSVTFVDNNTRFISSSDDKKLLVWEYGIPVVIKYISEPHMHSIPAITPTPNGKWILGQSMDNQIVVYEAQDRFRFNKKKAFRGHICAGFSIQPGISTDCRYVTSGDSGGNLWIWDWKTTRTLKKLRAHDGVCTSSVWHPIEPGNLATAGWDGIIKYWTTADGPA